MINALPSINYDIKYYESRVREALENGNTVKLYKEFILECLSNWMLTWKNLRLKKFWIKVLLFERMSYTTQTRNYVFGQDHVSLRSKIFKNQNMHTIRNTKSEDHTAKN